MSKDKVYFDMGLKSCDKCEYYLRCEECVGSHYKEEMPKLNQQITDLEAELAEMTENYKACQEARKLEIEFNKQDKAELKQQLTESEEKCNKQWLEIQAETHQIQMLEQDIKRIKKELKQQLSEKDQDKISFCVEQLEKVKDFCDGMKWSMVYITQEDTTTIQTVLDEINNQIKQLKGEK